MIPFGLTPSGEPAQLFVLQDRDGAEIALTDYGATLVRWRAPDRRGQLDDVVLGFNRVEAYAAHTAYFGAIVGRYGNRIAHGRFTLDGRTHELATNNAPAGIPCHLHGGRAGFDRKIWASEFRPHPTQPAVTFRLRSPDGDEGYPGNLDVTVTYTLVGAGELQIDYLARSDRATPVNLTNHVYFNLAGEQTESILGHVVTLQASSYLPVDAGMIPTGEVAPVGNTPFDFRAPCRIGERIEHPNEQLRLAAGYDHNFILDPRTDPLAPAGLVFEPQSGRLLEFRTTEPGVQFYTGNFINGSEVGKSGHAYGRRSGFCLETQHFPDSPNQPSFPSTILRPGQTWTSRTVYRLSTR